MIKIVIISITVAVIGIAITMITKKPVVYPKEYIIELANKFSFNTNEKYPLVGFTAIVTGSTGGLGREIAAELFSLGAHVIVASRNKSKCEQTIEEIKAEYLDSKGSLEVGVIDTADLDSVVKFVNDFKAKHKDLHILMNNAGIHYISNGFANLYNLKTNLSPQGYDQAFATNYLGHFLLTHLLQDILIESAKVVSTKNNKPFYSRIVNMASSYHFQSDGTMLLPKIDENTNEIVGPPDAAFASHTNYLHKSKSYGNNKLAQLLHMKELQSRLASTDNNYIKTATTCPGWASTNMPPKGLLGKFIRANAFTPKAGTLSAMYGILNNDCKGGEFIGNSVDTFAHFKFFGNALIILSKLGLRDIAVDLLAMYINLVQSYTYGAHIEPSSLESNDKFLAKSLYDWTVQTLQRQHYIP